MLPVTDKVGPNYPAVAAATKIDELIVAKLRKLGIVPSELCTDAEFLRRVSLDLPARCRRPTRSGRSSPTPRPTSGRRRSTSCSQRPTYAAWWTTMLCDITGNNTNQLEIAGKYLEPEMARNWYDWIYRRVSENMPYDKMVEGIVLAVSRQPSQSYDDYCAEMTSYVRSEHPADFTQRETMPHFWGRRNMQKPEEKALVFSYTFLGVRLQCAECHKHPFDQWTQEDFDSFQAFFTGVAYQRQNRRDPEVAAMMRAVGRRPRRRKRQRQQARTHAGPGGPRWQDRAVPGADCPQPSRCPGTKSSRRSSKSSGSSRVITPKLLGGEEVLLANYADPRQPLMDWMRSQDNPYFARAWVNRVWAQYFGVGIIDPPDDLNLANPPSNAELLDYLTRGFVESGFDMKWLHRTIATSDAYQRSRKTNDTNELDRRNFSHALLRRLPAEVAMDAIAMATAGAAELGTAARRRPQSGTSASRRRRGASGRGQRDYSLGIFGRPDRITTCDCERSNEPTLLQSLFLYNDGEIHKLINAGGWINDLERVERYRDVDQQIRITRARLEQQEKNGEDKRAAATRAELAKLEAVRNVNVSDRGALADELYLRTVSRMPTARSATRRWSTWQTPTASRRACANCCGSC